MRLLIEVTDLSIAKINKFASIIKILKKSFLSKVFTLENMSFETERKNLKTNINFARNLYTSL